MLLIEDNLYGGCEFPDSFADIINSYAVQRLKRIHQNGAAFMVNPNINTTRYGHSIGTMILVKILGAGTDTQLSALVHDVSHTAFSHVSDSLVKRKTDSYHELIRDDFIKKTGLFDIILNFGLDAEKIATPKNYPVLDKPSPDLCADRLDYFFRDLYAMRMITLDDIRDVLDNLVFDGDVIKCRNIRTARFIFENFLRLNRDIFFSSECEAADALIADLISRLMADGTLSFDDLMNDDSHVLGIIQKSRYSDMLSTIHPDMRVIDITCHSDQNIPNSPISTHRRKLRYVNPVVEGTCKRITELDSGCSSMLKEYLRTRTEINYVIQGI